MARYRRGLSSSGSSNHVTAVPVLIDLLRARSGSRAHSRSLPGKYDDDTIRAVR